MKGLKVLGAVFLAVYLFIVGLAGLGGFVLAGVPLIIVHLLALLAGVIILITVGQCWHCDNCNHHHDVK